MGVLALGLASVALAGCEPRATTELVSVNSAEQPANRPARVTGIDAHGRFVVFQSEATNLAPGGASDEADFDVFVRDRVGGTTERVSVSSAGQRSDVCCDYNAEISDDGRFVSFISEATNLVPGDTNGTASDVFVRDRKTGTTTMVDLTADGRVPRDGVRPDRPSLSGDGRYVAFMSRSDDIVGGDTNHVGDVFVRDRQAGTTRRVSIRPGGGQFGQESFSPSISGDGRYVAFTVRRTVDPTDPFPDCDLYLRDLSTGTTRLLRHGAVGPALSRTARYVAFSTYDDLFLLDRSTGAVRQVDRPGSDVVSDPEISGDGRLVAFSSDDPGLVPGDTNGHSDVFVWDQEDSTYTRAVSDSGQQFAETDVPVISDDGTVFGFSTTNGKPGGGAFVRTR
jgi:Tol biopolymer transport system component